MSLRQKLISFFFVMLLGVAGTAAAAPLVMPHLTGGDSGWNDILTVDCTDSAGGQVTVALFDRTGRMVYSNAHAIAPYGETVINLKQLNSTAWSGAVTVTRGNQVHCRLALQSNAGGGVAEFLLNDALSDKLAFLFGDFPMVQWKGLALFNYSYFPGTVTLYALGSGRLLGTSAPLHIGVHEKIIGVVSTWFPGLDYRAVKKIVAVSDLSSLSGVAIAGDGSSARLLFTAAVPLAGFTPPSGGGGSNPGSDPVIVDPGNGGGGYAGVWRGSWASSHGLSGYLEIELGQAGARVSGPGSMNSTHCGDLDLPFAGEVTNNLLTLDTAFICMTGSGYGQMTFTQTSWSGGNTISGTWREIFNNVVYDTGTFTLTRQ